MEADYSKLSEEELDAIITKGKKPASDKSSPSFRAALSGAARSLPGSDILSGYVKSEIDRNKKLFRGELVEPEEYFEGIKSNISKFKKKGEYVESKAPITALLASLPGMMATGSLAKGAAVKALPFLAKSSKATGAGSKGLNFLRGLLQEGVSNVAGTQGAEGFTPEDIPLQAALGAGGEVLTSGAKALGKGLKRGGSRVVNSLLKPTADEVKMGKNIGAEYLEKSRLPRTLGGLESMGKAGVDKYEAALQPLLKDLKGPVNKELMLDELNKLRSTIYQQVGEKANLTAIDEAANHIIDNLPEEISASEANVIKRNLYNTLGDKAYKADPTATAISKGMKKAQARGLKLGIEDIAQKEIPEGAQQVQDLNKQLSFYGRLLEKSQDVAAREQGKNLLKLIPYLASAGGGVLGSTYGGERSGLLGTLGAVLPILMGTPIGKTIAAQLLRHAGEGIPLATKTATPITSRIMSE